MTIETLLSRLKKVKSTSRNRWSCLCPSHQDKSPSMHVQLMDDGKILINCKAGCETYDIIQSIGLDWADVMPESPTHHRQKPKSQVLYPSEALMLIQNESRIIMACAYAMRNNTLTNNDLMRAEKAMQTINKVNAQAGI